MTIIPTTHAVDGTETVSRGAPARPATPRTFDGRDNNARDPRRGSAGSVIRLRHGEPDPDRYPGTVGARTISNLVNRERRIVADPYGRSNMVWAWGQLVDHELDHVLDDTSNSEPIAVPWDDPQAARGATGIPFSRSARTGGELVNIHSSYMDGGNVYGSDPSRAAKLRSPHRGKLRTSSSPYQQDLLPRIADVRFEPGGRESPHAFAAGDSRVNEHAVLTSMHTLFVREHNRRCDELYAADPTLSPEEAYQRARHWVIGVLQAITFSEFVPALLGPGSFTSESVYDPEIDPSVSLDFATVAFRLGHSMLPSKIHAARLGRLVALQDLFFDHRNVEWHGIEPWLGGLPSTPMSAIDTQVTAAVRDFLFVFADDRLIDLASLNIQRGRDHGIPPYVELRRRWGLPDVSRFDDITDDAEVVGALARAYDDVEQVDAWVGALAEKHAPRRRVGPLLFAILNDQFTRMRDGDRYALDRDPVLSDEERAQVGRTRLSDVMRRNLHGDTSWVPDDVFHVH